MRAIRPSGNALDALADAMRVSGRREDQADALIGCFVDQARRTGASWRRIGESMGMSKQAGQQRHVARAGDLAWGSRLFERFTPRARNALVVARRLAADGDRAVQVEPRRIVGVLLSEPDSIAARAVHTLGISDRKIFDALHLPPIIPPGSGAATEQNRSDPFGADATKLTAHSPDIALRSVHDDVGTEHLILSAAAEGPVEAELGALGLGSARLRPVVRKQLGAVHAAEQTRPE